MHNNNYTCVSIGAERAADRTEPGVLNSGRGNCTLCVYSWNEFMSPPPPPPQVQVGEKRGSLTFFEECDTYWKPAPNRECLYAQLAHRKYREIPRHQIQ